MIGVQFLYSLCSVTLYCFRSRSASILAQRILCIQYIQYILYTVYTVYTVYSIYSIYSIHCIYCIQYILYILYILYAVYTVFYQFNRLSFFLAEKTKSCKHKSDLSLAWLFFLLPFSLSEFATPRPRDPVTCTKLVSVGRNSVQRQRTPLSHL